MSYRAFIGDLTQSTYVELIRDGLKYIEFESFIHPNSRVFIKPNLTFPYYKPGVMTNPEAIEAAIIAIRDYTSNIFIGDSDSGGYNRFSMDTVYQETGISNFAAKYHVEVVNLSHGPRRPIHFSIENAVSFDR
jgi:uncharacterized protein (DUF362 family)